MRRSLLLDTTCRLVFDSAIVFSLYLLFSGHNQPGGGFVGGLVAGAAVALRFVTGGIAEVRRVSPVRPWFVLAGGLGLAAITAIVPMLLGSPLLDHAKAEWDLPILGSLKVTSAVVFDAGVYLVVVGLVLMLFEALGDESAVASADATEDAR
jgi:multisubunit Na+/H+ antiporter MnhB subunit